MSLRFCRDPRLAAGLLVASLAVLAWSVRRALELEPVPASASSSPAAGVAISRGALGLTASQLSSAVDRNPFHPERRRPAERFRLPGEGVSAGPPSEGVPAQALMLIGTAVLPEGRGFAMCRWGSDAPKLVRIGERIGDVTLQEVNQGRAVFRSATGERLEVKVRRAGA
jgi:hypothetical protein